MAVILLVELLLFDQFVQLVLSLFKLLLCGLPFSLHLAKLSLHSLLLTIDGLLLLLHFRNVLLDLHLFKLFLLYFGPERNNLIA